MFTPGQRVKDSSGLTVEKIMLLDHMYGSRENHKIILRGAGTCLGVRNIAWENINKIIGGDGKPGHQETV